MQQVWIMGEKDMAEAMACHAAALQNSLEFQPRPGTNSVPVRLLNDESGLLFRADAETGVSVNVARLKGTCEYLRLPRELYLLTVSMLGLLQYRAVQQNPALREVDFLHQDKRWCLLSRPIPIEDAPLFFDPPRVCQGCWDFYRQVSPAGEVRAARLVLEHTARIIEAAFATSEVS